ncbi:hypothetical protein ABTQ33_01335 [Paucilactobacillus suebicus]|uniref:DUF7671 domain-containing protein n=1 Tax=Paucilactobacillus suebicus DSM 5007 = KCTC 3549 TaxID=1423807 RepID=A0A0R1W3K1_9LACO|nr:hypothetical protein [Paucilactobacillus suebicus]KRM12408.1 hypothetical protein FD16_GL002403 [Paucilactobacillus suebicus DSM 5007 = KCTC 3549]
MAKNAKYEVHRYTGLPVEMDNSGNYYFKQDAHGEAKFHVWRTGKHTKGKFKHLGQLFLTENDLLVAVIKVEKMAFKDRHSEVPLQRFTSETISDELLKNGLSLLEQVDGEK